MSFLEEYKGKNKRSFRVIFYESGVRRSVALPGVTTKEKALLEQKKLDRQVDLRRALRLSGSAPALSARNDKSARDISLSDFAVYLAAERSREVDNGSITLSHLNRLLYSLSLFIELFPERSLNSLSPADLEFFKRSRSEKISLAGAKKDLENLLTVFRWAYKNGLLLAPIYDRVKSIKTVKKLPGYFTPEQIDAIEKYIYPDLALFAFRIVKFSGVRRTELTKIRWKDIRENFILLPHTKTRVQRTIPLCRALRQVLEERRDLIDPEPDDFLVPLHPDTITDYFKKAIQAAGLDDRGKAVHIIRHSLGSYLAAKGFHLNEIAQILGHETLEMAKHYSAIPDPALIHRLDDIFPEIAETKK